ncbi:MAG: hypothetical protein AAF389_15870 [Gemmatimonadota bacterium]
MARKRKKSKSKSKKRKQRASAPEADASESTDVEASSAADAEDPPAPDPGEGLEEAIDLDADLDGQSVEDLLAEASALAGGEEPADETASLEGGDRGPDDPPDSAEPENAKPDREASEEADDIDLVVLDEEPTDDDPPLRPDGTSDEESITTISLDDDLDEDAADLIAQAIALSDEELPAVRDDEVASASPDAGDEGSALHLPADQAGTPGQPPVMTRDALDALRELRTQGVGPGDAELVLDLGEGGTPEDRDRLLQAALAHVEMQDAVYRVPTAVVRPRRLGAAATAAVLVVALWVAFAPPSILVPPEPPTPTEAELLDGVRATLWLHMQQVESFRVEAGRLPRDISELADPHPGIQYVRSSNRLYQLVMRTADGRTVMYDSGSPAADFDGMATRFGLDTGGS